MIDEIAQLMNDENNFIPPPVKVPMVKSYSDIAVTV